MRKHLAIMGRLTIEAILSGRKTIETRFSQHKIPPFNLISVEDIVYMKPPGEEIVGQFRVKKVFSFEGLENNDLNKIFAEYGPLISIGDKAEDTKYQKSKIKSRYGTLIFISESDRFITSPLKITKSDRRGWVVLG